ncbi:MAG TPA: amidase [Mycobacteriales bacterium]
MNTLLSALRALRRGQTDPVELTEVALRCAEERRSHNAIATLTDRAARDRARELRAEPEPVGPLHGMPVTVKDLFAVRGTTMRAGTGAPLPAELTGSQTEALAVARMRAAGAIVLGTTNMVEIAMGITGENPVTGDVGNAHDPARQSGGSSSGSAVAVALGVGLASLGSDTAGSIRIPAALNGVVGLKPSYRMVPLDGALALSVTCDHGGPLTRTVADARLMLSVLAGQDVAAHPVSAPRFGVPWRFLEGRLGVGVRECFGRLVDRLGAAGARIVDARLPDVEALLSAYNPLTRPEAAWVHRAALEQDPDRFSPPVRDALLEGRGYSALDYLAARQVRADARQRLAAELSGVDALLLPGAPVPASPRGATEVRLESGPVPHRTAFLPLTLPFSVTGVPAVTLPMGLVDGLPVGVQLVAGFGSDARLLDLAGWVEARSLE